MSLGAGSSHQVEANTDRSSNLTVPPGKVYHGYYGPKITEEMREAKRQARETAKAGRPGSQRLEEATATAAPEATSGQQTVAQ